LKGAVPVVSTGVLYLLAVLVISTYWGLWLGLFTSVVSAASFNFFHLPPVGRLTISDPENWVALGVFLLSAVLATALAHIARSRAREAELRRREADLVAEMARLIMGGTTVEDSLRTASQRMARALGVSSASIELRDLEGDSRRLAFPLTADARRIGTLLL